MRLFTKNPKAKGNAARTAFEILVREHHRGLLAFARSLVTDAGIAEDLVQDAFIVAWRKLDQFDPEQDFGAWVRGMIRFEYLHWARKKRETLLDEEIIDHIDAMHTELAEHTDDRDHMMDIVRQCVGALPASLREVVQSVYATGLSCPEIATREGASEAAIRKRLQRGRESVAICIDTKVHHSIFAE